MALAEYGNALNIDTDGSGNPILVDPQSGDVIAIYDRASGAWQVTEIEATTGDFDSVNTEKATHDISPTPLATASGLNQPHNSFADPETGILVAGKGNTVRLIDFEGTELTVSGGFTNAQTIRPLPSNDRFAVVGSDDGIDAIDKRTLSGVSNLSGPTRVNGEAWDAANDVMVFADKSGTIWVVDVSDPTALTVIESQDVSSSDSFAAPHDVAIKHDHIVSVNQADGGEPKIAAWNAYSFGSDEWKNGTAPAWGTASSSINRSDMNGANRITKGFYGQYCYVANNYSDTVAVIDWSDPTSLTHVTTVNTQHGAPSGLTRNVSGDGHLLCAAQDTGYEVWDIQKDPTLEDDPVVSYDFGVSKGGHDSAFYNGRLYITAQATDELIVHDFAPFRTGGVLS